MDTRFPALETANQVIAWTSLIVISVLELAVFFKLRFKMDRAVLFLMLTFILILIQRKILDFFKYPPLSVTVLGPIASITSYALLYYFVFEMMCIVSTIKSMSPVDRADRNERIRKIKIILFTLYFGIYTPSTLIGHILYKEDPQYYYEQITLFRVN